MSTPVTLQKRTKGKCRKCGKEFWENPDIKVLQQDGTTISSESILDLCPKHLRKHVDKRVWLMQKVMSGALTKTELEDYQLKKISEERLNIIIRERENVK